ncbi:MAG TPA: hypothetical protein PK335_14240, partial [Draconibacterium sp.]|nr:hypothetical protein [Draconibacterium sp.]
MKINNINIQGVRQTENLTEQHADSNLTLIQSFQISGRDRGKMESFDITLKDDELIEFVFDDDTIWLANPETLDQIFPEEALKEDKRGISQFQIPTEITMPADERGIVKKALVRLVNILA